MDEEYDLPAEYVEDSTQIYEGEVMDGDFLNCLQQEYDELETKVTREEYISRLIEELTPGGPHAFASPATWLVCGLKVWRVLLPTLNGTPHLSVKHTCLGIIIAITSHRVADVELVLIPSVVRSVQNQFSSNVTVLLKTLFKFMTSSVGNTDSGLFWVKGLEREPILFRALVITADAHDRGLSESISLFWRNAVLFLNRHSIEFVLARAMGSFLKSNPGLIAEQVPTRYRVINKILDVLSMLCGPDDKVFLNGHLFRLLRKICHLPDFQINNTVKELYIGFRDNPRKIRRLINMNLKTDSSIPPNIEESEELEKVFTSIKEALYLGNVYDFVEFSHDPKVKSVIGTSKEWIFEFLAPFCLADLNLFEANCRLYEEELASSPELMKNKVLLLRKLKVVHLWKVLHGFLPSERIIPLQTLSLKMAVSIPEIESLLMTCFCLAAGLIDQVDGNVCVTSVKRRLLLDEVEERQVLERMAIWIDGVTKRIDEVTEIILCPDVEEGGHEKDR